MLADLPSNVEPSDVRMNSIMQPLSRCSKLRYALLSSVYGQCRGLDRDVVELCAERKWHEREHRLKRLFGAFDMSIGLGFACALNGEDFLLLYSAALSQKFSHIFAFFTQFEGIVKIVAIQVIRLATRDGPNSSAVLGCMWR